MGTGYTRNDTPNNIADGNVINASDLDGEFDAIQSAFNGSTGHSHDGTTGEGPQIATAGLADNAVTTAKITDSNVTTAKIADSNVTLAKMATNSVDSDQYVDGSIDRVHLAADIVDGTKIADDSIDSEHYVDGSIDTAHIADDAVTSAKLDTNIQIAGTLGVTGVSSFADGSNSAPSLTFTSDTNTGIYRGGTDILKFVTAGTDAITINASQDVTFAGNITGGLTSTGDLDVSATNPRIRMFETDTTDLNTQLQTNGGNFLIKTLLDDASNSTSRITIDHSTGDISFYEDTGTTAKFFWDASTERLGIGTVSPSNNLSVVDSSTTGIISLGDSSDSDYIRLVSQSSLGTAKLDTDGELFIDRAGNNLYFRKSGSTQMFIDASGRVGIGTGSPTQKLQVSGASSQYVSVISTDSGNTGVLFGDATKVDEGYVLYANSDDSLNFGSNGTERMRIDSSGNVGIGVVPETWTTASSTRALQVGDVTSIHEVASQYSRFASNMYYDGTFKYITSNPATRYTQQGGTHVWDYASSGSADGAITFNEAMRIDSSGNVGIGVTPEAWDSAFSTLQVGGTGALRSDAGAGSGDTVGVSQNAYYDSNNGRWEYLVTDEASDYYQQSGSHYWRVAPSGSADAAITWTNAMVINNSGNVGIGTSSPTSYANSQATLVVEDSINPSIAISDTGQGKDYYIVAFGSELSIRYADGGGSGSPTNITELIKMDNSGAVTMPNQPAFLVRPTSDISNIAVGSEVTIEMGTEIFDQNSDYNNATYTFTAPVTGKYRFDYAIRLQNVDTASGYYLGRIYTTNRNYDITIDTDEYTSDLEYYHISNSVLADMDSGDTAILKIYQDAGTSQTDINSNNTRFSGNLVC